MKINRLFEAPLDYTTQVRKMRDWHNGVRNQNLNMSDEKLKFNYDICASQGYTKEANILMNIAVDRNLSWAAQRVNVNIFGVTFFISADDFDKTLAKNVLNTANIQELIDAFWKNKNSIEEAIKKLTILAIFCLVLNRPGDSKTIATLISKLNSSTLDKVKSVLIDVIKNPVISQKLSTIRNELLGRINESIEKHDTLNPKLWDIDTNTLKSEVKDKIMQIVDDFLKGLKNDEIKFNLTDIKLVGSNCSYNYNKDSDLDVHLVMETGSLHCPDNLYPLLYSAYRSLYNGKLDIDFYGIPVEIFVETDDTEQLNEPEEPGAITEARVQTALKSNGIYSVLNNSWIKEPIAEDIPEIDKDAFDAEFKKWEDRYNNLVNKSENTLAESKESDIAKARSIIADQIRGEWDADKGYTKAASDLAELEDIETAEAQDMLLDIASEEHVHAGELETIYSAFDPELFSELQDGHVEADKKIDQVSNEKEKAIKILESAEETQINKIEKFIEDIYDLRKKSIGTDGEYGIGNLVFKEIRNKGYLDALKELKNKLKSQELSLVEELN